MFDFFKKKPTPKPITLNIVGVNPDTDNEFLFYDFVCKTSNYILEPWLKKIKEEGYKIKPIYEQAIQEKLKTDKFVNPHKFPDYFEASFDTIAIDFETANNSRLSACAIGLNFVKNNKIVHSKKYYIKPPQGEAFLSSHTAIHGITKEDVEYAMTFEELWYMEFHKYFCTNLIIFHNASMDLSILKNMFECYKINEFEISYIDTMTFAEKLGYPKKLTELAQQFKIDIKKHHDPESDAETCSLIFGELIDRYTNYKELIRKISSKPTLSSPYQNTVSPEVLTENKDYIHSYAITFDELQTLEIATKGFVITGVFKYDREVIANFLMRQGGQVKPAITSKVSFVVAGEDCGWAKIQKINELNISGKANIKILNSQDLEYLMKKYGI